MPSSAALLSRTQQAPGRRRDYCSAACKQRAARERSRRNPAGAVVAARQRVPGGLATGD